MLGLIYKLQNILNQTSEPQDTSVVIADYILKNLRNKDSFSIKTISEDCNVSPASITRFAKQLSYNGFLDLKNSLMELPLETIEMSIDLETNVIKNTPSFNEYSVSLANRISNSLSSFIETEELSLSELKKVSSLINEHQRVLFFATQYPANILLSVQHQLLTVNKFSQYFPLHKDQLQLSRELTKDDIVFFVSINGSYVMQKDITLNILNSDAYKILITQNNHMKLSSGFDRIILLGNRDDEIVGKYKLMFYLEQLMQVYYKEYMNPVSK